MGAVDNLSSPSDNAYPRFLPPHGTSVPEEFQDAVPDTRGWLLDGSSEPSQPHGGPLSYGASAPQRLTAITTTPLKRKRSSCVSSNPATPFLKAAVAREESLLCSRCKIYVKTVSQSYVRSSLGSGISWMVLTISRTIFQIFAVPVFRYHLMLGRAR